jgi:hypothetical protein
LQQSSEFKVGRGKFAASIHNHDDGSRFFEGHPRLPEDFRRDKIFLIRNNSAGIDNPHLSSAPFGLSIEAIARNSRFIADYGASRSYDFVE